MGQRHRALRSEAKNALFMLEEVDTSLVLDIDGKGNLVVMVGGLMQTVPLRPALVSHFVKAVEKKHGRPCTHTTGVDRTKAGKVTVSFFTIQIEDGARS